MVTLAIDTSHAIGSAALAVDGAVAGVQRFEEPSSHLVALGHAVETLLSAAGRGARDVDRVAVVIGPGSFTGLRIGLAFAKGLHAALGVEMVVIDSLRLLALPHLAGIPGVCAMIDARRGEVYAAVYAPASAAETETDAGSAREVVAPCAQAPDALLDSLAAAPALFVGTGVPAHADRIRSRFPHTRLADDADAYPSTAHLAAIAPRMRPLEKASIRSLEPLYVRPSGAERMRLRPVRRAGDEPPGSDP
jgi:tRNA threonylcarbamoyladenosine biosynthesis protein TsaB